MMANGPKFPEEMRRGRGPLHVNVTGFFLAIPFPVPSPFPVLLMAPPDQGPP